MAAICMYNNFLKTSLRRNLKCWTQSVKFKSSAHVVLTDDASVVVCWHPEKKFPYEMSLPIPETKKVESHSVLKVQSRKELLSVLKPKHDEVVRKELMSLTYTTKHIWFPEGKKFRRTKKPEKQRPYL